MLSSASTVRLTLTPPPLSSAARIRTYSTSCNQTQLTLQAIDDTKVNMTVWIGAYVGDNSTVNEQQQQDVLDALTLYGTEHVSGITIGNECVLLRSPLVRSSAASLGETKLTWGSSAGTSSDRRTRPPRSSSSSPSKPPCVPIPHCLVPYPRCDPS